MKLFKIVFSLDLRSLALLRISLAITILIDLLLRSRDLVAHYTDQGILPRSLLSESIEHPWEWTFHSLGGGANFEIIIFILTGIFAFCLLLGYKTRVATILCWIFLVSLHNRNSLILFGADRVLILSLFWSIFLPLGKKFSLDSLMQKNQIKETAVVSAATIAYLVQIFIIYFFNFLSKIGSPEWQQGTAVYSTLNTIFYTTPFGEFLSHFPQINKFLSFMTLGVEGILPFVLFLPIWNSLGRLIFFICLCVMHIGFGLSISLGMFTLASITLLTPLIPKEFWDLVVNMFHKKHFLNKKLIRPFIQIIPNVESNYTPKLNLPASAFVLSCLIYVIFWNVANVKNFSYVMPKKLRSIGYALHLEQQWNFFSSFPPKIFSWYVVVGELKNGDKINLLNPEKEIDFERPPLGVPYYQNNRWGVYFVHLTNMNNNSAFVPLVNYYCRSWNKKNLLSKSLTQVEVFLLRQKELSALNIYEPLKKNSVLKVPCN